MKGGGGGFVGLVGTRDFFPGWAALIGPVYKIFFLHTVHYLTYKSPSPSQLGRQSCRVSCLFISVSRWDTGRLITVYYFPSFVCCAVSEPGVVSGLLIDLAAEADVTPGILALIIQETNSRFCHSHELNGRATGMSS